MGSGDIEVSSLFPSNHIKPQHTKIPVDLFVSVLYTLDTRINLIVAAYEMGQSDCLLLILIFNYSLVSL